MYHPTTTGLSLDDLLQQANAQGLPLTREKLHRWRKAGLLPTPDVRSLGRGLGRVSTYPTDALMQVLTIGELLKRSRDLDIARWLLFLDGFPVSMRQLRKQLSAEISDTLREREEARIAADTDDDAIAQRFLDDIASDAKRRGRTPLMRHLRKLLGREDAPAFIALVRQMGTGRYEENPFDRDLAARAFGIVEPVPANGLAWFATFVDPVPVAVALQQADDRTLAVARVEFQSVATALRQFADMIPGLGSVLALEMRRRPDWPPMMAFLLWLRHRQNPQAQHALALVSASLAESPQVPPQ